MSPRRHIRSALVGLGLLLAGLAPAAAHPHVFVDSRAQIVFDATGQIVAIRHVWRFDDAFSAFASQGLDKNGDGVLSIEELQPLAKVNVDSLKDYDYFTFLRVAGKRVGFKIPTEYWLQSADGFLTLFYTLNLMQPVKPDAKGITLDVYDPGYFVDFQMVEKEPIVLEKAPAACKANLQRKGAPDAATAAILGQIPASERELPAELKALTSDLANRITVTCP
ncbi:MAG: DUF1007 family protein [Hyphomicrobiales bacterium]|nr:DUF1007 family protein [Hyphomicrobiales bacterium]